MPKVSICLPNLNTAKYLPDRLDSIFSQTFEDWELIVYDSFSDDGAWEIFQSYARRDPRMQIHQGPREGIYAGFNSCIVKAKGEFIYIATSDDTMMPDCLEKMVAGLDEHPECGLCQCALEIIDENGDPHEWKWHNGNLARFAPDWLKTQHLRPAPLDGVLHFALHTIYLSITQLLIRKTIFDSYGLFQTHWGSMADFEWGMRISLLESSIYIPHALATWRIHPSQATGNMQTVKARRLLRSMAVSAYNTAKSHNTNLNSRIPSLRNLLSFYDEQVLSLLISQNRNRARRAVELFSECLRGNTSAVRYFLLRGRLSITSETDQYSRLHRMLATYNLHITTFA